MNGLLRSGAVTAAVGALITYIATHLQDLLSDAVLSWILISTGSAITCLAFSWGWTQAYKFLFVDTNLQLPPDTTGMSSVAEMTATRQKWEIESRHARRGIYACAMLFCLLPSIALGSVLLLLHVDQQVRMVFGIVWGVGSLALCGASPWLWRVIFMQIVPWMLAKEKA